MYYENVYDLKNAWNLRQIAEDFLNKYVEREKRHIQYLNGAVFDKNHRYYAIPLTEIDRSYVDGKPTLTQNPGY